jgi:hypothetical protein
MTEYWRAVVIPCVLLMLVACGRSTDLPAAKSRPSETADTGAQAIGETPAAVPDSEDQALAGFYRGKVLRLIVGTPAGGGYDTYARSIARVIGKSPSGNNFHRWIGRAGARV